MPSLKRVFSIVVWFAWSLGAWVALAGAVFYLSRVPENWTGNVMGSWLAALALPSLGVLFAWMALKAGMAAGGKGNGRRWPGVVFWLAAFPSVALFALSFRVQCRELTRGYDRHLLLVVGVLPLLVLAFAVARELRARGWKAANRSAVACMLDAAGGIACFAILVVVAYFAWMQGRVEPLRHRAEQRWAEIGRPMPAFGETMRPVAENDSLRALTEDLKPFGVVTLYQAGSLGDRITAENKVRYRITAENKVKIPAEVFEFLGNSEMRAGGPIKLSPKASAKLDASAADFDRLYVAILRRDPPVWGIDPSAGFDLLVPNYITLRKLAQWIVVDTYHRLELGDEKGAADAMAADLRMMHGLGEQPILVSIMINTAVKCLFAPVTARLPEDPGAMQRLAGDVETERRQFQTTIQEESWALMHTLEKTHPSPEDLESFLGKNELPDWLERRFMPVYSYSFFRYECSHAWLFEADVTGICERASDLVSTDLGEREMGAAEERHPSIFAPNLTRAWLRLNCGLLVREQAEMIRSARAQIQAGRSGNLGSFSSVVIPNSKWEITGDSVASTITAKLTPLPEWAAANEVASNEFWLVPLDGSKPWKLQPRAATTGISSTQQSSVATSGK
ncbi:MAG: hypothetical protein WCD79_18460 [Chthoniobacteraceae bacterium]